MIERGIAEIGCVAVAGRARAAVMIGRRRMTGGAVCSADGGVVEDGVGKIFGVAVAGATGAGIMAYGRGVAGGAVVVADEAVVEVDGLPIADAVAGGAICPKNAIMRIILGMAGGASWRWFLHRFPLCGRFRIECRYARR